MITQILFDDPLFRRTASINTTMPEIWRVLKRGGYYFAIDDPYAPILLKYNPIFVGGAVTIIKKE